MSCSQLAVSVFIGTCFAWMMVLWYIKMSKINKADKEFTQAMKLENAINSRLYKQFGNWDQAGFTKILNRLHELEQVNKQETKRKTK